MLKSRFNITAKRDDDESKREEGKNIKKKEATEGQEGTDLEQLGEQLNEEEVIVKEDEIKEVIEERKLHSSEISVRLSFLGKTAEGDGYTYLKAACTGMALTDITAIKSFKHLQFVDVSKNKLTLDGLQAVTELPYLILIHADENRLSSAALKAMKYMQIVILNHNKITSVNDVYQPELCTLEVGYNLIQKINLTDHMPNIKCLDFRYNFIQEITIIDLPNLDSLYLAGNKITSLVGIENLVNLRILHVRNNPIKYLNGFSPELKKLQYINLRNCKVSTLIQVKKLRVLTGLNTLIMKGCPYMGGTGKEGADADAEEEDSAELRIEMFAALPRLTRINKETITPEERIEANDLMKQWLEEGEQDEEEIIEEHHEEELNEY